MNKPDHVLSFSHQQSLLNDDDVILNKQMKITTANNMAQTRVSSGSYSSLATPLPCDPLPQGTGGHLLFMNRQRKYTAIV